MPWIVGLAAALLVACGGAAADPDAGFGGDGGGAGRDARPADAGAPADAPPHDEIFGGRLLGANLVGPDLVEFTLFAPRASSVHVVGTFNDWDEAADPLELDASSGIWRRVVPIADPIGQRYRFLLDGERRVADIYAKASVQTRGDSIILDPPLAADPGWSRPARDALVIYEMHISDFTHHPSSGVPAADRGRYAGLKARLPHLERLGINAVELMPVSESQSDAYTWGYNPSLLFAPEAGFASAADERAVAELREAIAALHQAGIAVIVDVVYNHVSGQAGINPFWDVDPLYYFDDDDDGDVEDDRIPWGYKMATWRPMVRKLMYDNMKYWMDVYGVDGFRVDSTENVDIDAIVDVVLALREAGYDDRYYIFEEFSSAHNERIRAVNQEVGAVAISSWGTGYKNTIWSAVTLGAQSEADLGTITYYSHGLGWNRPAEVINYFSSHDEGTLSARFGAAEPQVRVAAVHLLTSLGVPMFWMGEEFRRLHWGNYHPQGSSVALSRAANEVDWTRAAAHDELIDFFGALVRLRLAHPALRLAIPGPYPDHLSWFSVDWESAIGWTYKNVAGDHDFVVLVNYQANPVQYSVTFPRPGTWYTMCDGARATHEAPGLASRTVGAAPVAITVPAHSGLVFMSADTNP